MSQSLPATVVDTSMDFDASAREERDRLTVELRELLAVVADPSDRTRRRGSAGRADGAPDYVYAGVSEWLFRSDAFLFSGCGTWSRLTDWGSSVLTELLSVCVQNRTQLGPSVGRWMRDYLVPVLFPKASDAGSPHWELVRLLLLALLETTPAVTAPVTSSGADGSVQ